MAVASAGDHGRVASESGSAHPVVLFDGDCNLCNSSVQWILRRDRRARFRFASLQSAAGTAVLRGVPTPQPLPDAMVLVQDGRAHVRSGAVLRIAGGLGLPWSLAAVFLLVPWPLRDFAYDFLARRRHRWFGRTTTCMVPTPALRARFLDAAERDAAATAVRPTAPATDRPAGRPAG